MMQYKTFDDFYSASDKPSFGLTASFELRDYLKANPFTGKALDLGCGDGRDTLFLLSHRFDTTAIDTSQIALDKLKRFASDKGLSENLSSVCCDFTSWNFPINSFDIIISATGLDHITIEQTKSLLSKLYNSLKFKGILFLFVHTIDDPGFKKDKKNSELSHMIKHYFDHNELLNLMLKLNTRILRYEERIEDDFDHGDPHQHGFASVIAQKLITTEKTL